MIKIITYVDNPFDNSNRFSHASAEDSKKRIYAEDELEQLLSDGWTLLSATTSNHVVGGFGANTSFLELTVILRKN